MNDQDLSRLRSKQNRIIEIVDSRGFDPDMPISDLQIGCPTANQMRTCVYPVFEPCMDSFLREFDGN